MDKSTLSNYGWVVIAVLVLSVMIALATPFGTYIRQGVETTTAGLFDTSEKALNVVGMSAGDGGFESGSDSSETPVTPIDYEIIEGAGQTVATADASFRSTADYNKFESVKVDNNLVDPSNYSVSEGSTIIKFKGEYLATLSNGTHTLEVVSNDGSASCEFTVNIITEPETSSYKLNGIWTLNNSINITEALPYQKINFIANETNYYGISVGYDSYTLPNGRITEEALIAFGKTEEFDGPADMRESICIYSYTTGLGAVWAEDNSIEDDTYKIINFGTTPQTISEEFYEWFTANATKNG